MFKRHRVTKESSKQGIENPNKQQASKEGTGIQSGRGF
jgi:hypothetical protein